MLNHDRIRQRMILVGGPVEGLDAAFARFERSVEPQDDAAFYAWLLREGLVDAAGHAELVAAEAVTVLGELPQRLADALPAHVAEGAATRLPSGPAPDATRAPPPAGAEGAKPAHAASRYEVNGIAGRGGMATVLIARDTELLREVAMKALPADPPPNADVVGRFLREAQITAQLDHPHVVPVYSLEVTAEGCPAYTMKYIEGRTLGAYLEEARAFGLRGARPDESHQLPARLEHFLKVCDAIAYAHARGVVHRDLKPDNVMIGRHNEIYVMDWGICRLLDDAAQTPVPATPGTPAPALPDLRRLLASLSDASRTMEGGLIGTPRYMSPEQSQGQVGRIGPRSDQYSLGLMLYEIACLRRAYAGDTPQEVLAHAGAARLQPIVAPPGQARIAGELGAIIQRSTRLDPAHRYASVDALAADLRRYLRGQAVEARPDNAWQRAVRALARHRQLALAAMLVLFAVALASQVWVLRQRAAAAEALAVRDHKLQVVLEAVARRADLMQTRLLRVESLLGAFAAAAEQALLYGSEAPRRFYLAEEFDDPARAPPGLVVEIGFAAPISRQWSVWTLPPGMSRAQAAPQIERLVVIRDLRERLFEQVEAAMTDQAHARRDVPPAVESINLGLANGIASRHPGQAGMPAGYVAYTRPWYTLASDQDGTRWGAPFLGAVNRALVVPVSVAIRGRQRETLGVASVLLALEYLQRSFLDPATVPGASEILLLDARGQVQLGNGRPVRVSAGIDAAPPLQMLDDPAVLSAIARGDTGLTPVRRHGRERIAVHQRIAPLGWVMLAYVDLAAVPGSPSP